MRTRRIHRGVQIFDEHGDLLPDKIIQQRQAAAIDRRLKHQETALTGDNAAEETSSVKAFAPCRERQQVINIGFLLENDKNFKRGADLADSYLKRWQREIDRLYGRRDAEHELKKYADLVVDLLNEPELQPDLNEHPTTWLSTEGRVHDALMPYVLNGRIENAAIRRLLWRRVFDKCTTHESEINPLTGYRTESSKLCGEKIAAALDSAAQSSPKALISMSFVLDDLITQRYMKNHAALVDPWVAITTRAKREGWYKKLAPCGKKIEQAIKGTIDDITEQIRPLRAERRHQQTALDRLKTANNN